MFSEALTQQAPEVDEMSAAELLAAARDSRRAADAEEARLLVVAAQWAYLHPPAEPGDEAGFHTPSLDLSGGFETGLRPSSTNESPTDLSGGTRLPTAREVVFHLHFDTTTGPDGHTVIDPAGRLEEGARLLLLSQVKAWCRDSLTRISIKPVIDTAAELTTTRYEPTERQREQVILRDQHCLFPWCTRPARRCDLDHIVPFDPHAEAEGRPQPGPTTSSNLAALCRRHHRLKTHSAWRVEALAPGVLHWTSPHGHHYLVDRTGTTDPDGFGSTDPLERR